MSNKLYPDIFVAYKGVSLETRVQARDRYVK